MEDKGAELNSLFHLCCAVKSNEHVYCYYSFSFRFYFLTDILNLVCSWANLFRKREESRYVGTSSYTCNKLHLCVQLPNGKTRSGFTWEHCFHLTICTLMIVCSGCKTSHPLNETLQHITSANNMSFHPHALPSVSRIALNPEKKTMILTNKTWESSHVVSTEASVIWCLC